jgi:hypothetical protein
MVCGVAGELRAATFRSLVGIIGATARRLLEVLGFGAS